MKTEGIIENKNKQNITSSGCGLYERRHYPTTSLHSVITRRLRYESSWPWKSQVLCL